MGLPVPPFAGDIFHAPNSYPYRDGLSGEAAAARTICYATAVALDIAARSPDPKVRAEAAARGVTIAVPTDVVVTDRHQTGVEFLLAAQQTLPRHLDDVVGNIRLVELDVALEERQPRRLVLGLEAANANAHD